MLLFKPRHVAWICNVSPETMEPKTETRRGWKAPRVKVGSIHRAKTQMLSKDYFALLKILNVYKERLWDIDEAGARAEGCRDVLGYLRVFYVINNKPRPSPTEAKHLVERLHDLVCSGEADIPDEFNPEVYVVKYEVVEKAENWRSFAGIGGCPF